MSRRLNREANRAHRDEVRAERKEQKLHNKAAKQMARGNVAGAMVTESRANSQQHLANQAHHREMSLRGAAVNNPAVVQEDIRIHEQQEQRLRRRATRQLIFGNVVGAVITRARANKQHRLADEAQQRQVALQGAAVHPPHHPPHHPPPPGPAGYAVTHNTTTVQYPPGAAPTHPPGAAPTHPAAVPHTYPPAGAYQPPTTGYKPSYPGY